MLSKIDKIFLCLIMFFSITFTTTFVGPESLHLSPVRLLIVLYAIYKGVDLFIKKRISFTNSELHVFILLLAWILYATVVSVAFSKDISNSLNYIIYLLIAMIIFLAIIRVRPSFRDLKLLFRIFVCGIIVNNIISWYELFFHRYYFTMNIETEYILRHNYAMTFFANPNNLCSLLVFGFVIMMTLLQIEDLKIWKVIYIFTMLSSVLIMVANYSEANLIGIVVAVLFFFLSKLKIQSKITTKRFILITIVAAVVLINLNSILSFLLPYISSVYKSFSIGGTTTRERVDYAVTAIRNMFDHSLFLGVGAGNSMYYAAYNGQANIHNWFIEIFVDYGVLFFLVYIAFYFHRCRSLLKSFARNIKQNNTFYFELMYSTILFSFLFFNISSSSMFSQEYIWILLAIGLYVYSNQTNIRELMRY